MRLYLFLYPGHKVSRDTGIVEPVTDRVSFTSRSQLIYLSVREVVESHTI